jgi:hypothetical protein
MQQTIFLLNADDLSSSSYAKLVLETLYYTLIPTGSIGWHVFSLARSQPNVSHHEAVPFPQMDVDNFYERLLNYEYARSEGKNDNDGGGQRPVVTLTQALIHILSKFEWRSTDLLQSPSPATSQSQNLPCTNRVFIITACPFSKSTSNGFLGIPSTLSTSSALNLSREYQHHFVDNGLCTNYASRKITLHWIDTAILQPKYNLCADPMYVRAVSDVLNLFHGGMVVPVQALKWFSVALKSHSSQYQDIKKSMRRLSLVIQREPTENTSNKTENNDDADKAKLDIMVAMSTEGDLPDEIPVSHVLKQSDVDFKWIASPPMICFAPPAAQAKRAFFTTSMTLSRNGLCFVVANNADLYLFSPVSTEMGIATLQLLQGVTPEVGSV